MGNRRSYRESRTVPVLTSPPLQLPRFLFSYPLHILDIVTRSTGS